METKYERQFAKSLTESTKQHYTQRRNTDPLLEEVLMNSSLWQQIQFQGCNRPWIECRDSNGNLYTVYPQQEPMNPEDPTNVFLVVLDSAARNDGASDPGIGPPIGSATGSAISSMLNSYDG